MHIYIYIYVYICIYIYIYIYIYTYIHTYIHTSSGALPCLIEIFPTPRREGNTYIYIYIHIYVYIYIYIERERYRDIDTYIYIYIYIYTNKRASGAALKHTNYLNTTTESFLFQGFYLTRKSPHVIGVSGRKHVSYRKHPAAKVKNKRASGRVHSLCSCP